MTQVLDQTKQHGTTSMMLPLMLAIAAVGTQAAVAVAGSMRGLQTVATASAAASTIAAGADIVHMPHGADAVTALLSGACSRCCASAPCLWCAVRRRAAFCSVLWDKVCWRFVPAALVYPHAGSVKAGTFQNGRTLHPPPFAPPL